MAAPQNAMLIFLGDSGRTYPIDMYTADTAGFINTFNPSGVAVAGGTQYWKAPENVRLIQFSIPTGTTQVASFMTENAATKNGTVMRFAAFLDSLASPIRLNIPFQKGVDIGMTTI